MIAVCCKSLTQDLWLLVFFFNYFIFFSILSQEREPTIVLYVELLGNQKKISQEIERQHRIVHNFQSMYLLRENSLSIFKALYNLQFPLLPITSRLL